MTAPLSLYLDLVRWTAALVVFFGHIAGQRLTGGLLWQLGPYTAHAVTVFFVLSGFVVAYACDRGGGGSTGQGYAVARTARVLSVALPALLLTFVLDAAGQAANPSYYAAWWGFPEDTPILVQYTTAATFTGQLWWLGITVGSNLPYWSLQFEVWYYLIFGLALFASGRWRWPAVGAAVLVAGPPIAVLLPVWLMGVLAYRVCRDGPRLKTVPALALAAGAILLVGLYEASVFLAGARPSAGVEWFGRGVVQDYVVGGLFALHLVGMRHVLRRLPPAPVGGAIRWLAGASFTLYLLHLPVAQFLAAVLPGHPTEWDKRAAVILGTIGAVLLVARFTERRKEVWRGAVEMALARLRRAVGQRPPPTAMQR